MTSSVPMWLASAKADPAVEKALRLYGAFGRDS
jgi:hypothetical protein